MYLVRPTCTISVGRYMYTEVIYGYTYNYNGTIKLPLVRMISEVCLN